MKNLKFASKRFFSLQVVVLAFLLIPAIALGQNMSPLTGKYEGTARDSTGEAKVTLDLVEVSGKFSGTITTQLGVFKLIKGQMADGLLTLEFEPKVGIHKLSLREKDDRLIGTLLDNTKTADIELRKVAADQITGVWDATTDANGEPFPFSLTLKVT